MATKTIKFRATGDGVTSLSDGADGVVLATSTDGGEYAVAINGQSLGWFPDNNAAITAGGTPGAAPFNYYTVSVAAGATARQLKIDVAAGVALNVQLQTYMPDPTYSSRGIRLLDSDGTTALLTQPTGTVATEGIGNKQINTDGSLVAVGTADPGVNITPTGTSITVELPGTTGFGSKLTVITLTTAGGGGGGGASANTLQYLRDQARMAGIHSY